MNYHEIKQIDDIAKTVRARGYKGSIKIIEVNNGEKRMLTKSN